MFYEIIVKTLIVVVFLQYFFHDGSKDKLTLKHAEAIRAAFQEDKSVTAESIAAIIHKPKQKRGPVTVTFSKKALTKQYKLPQDFDIEAFMHAQLAEKFGTI
ncbi:hypothetical protein FACS18949_16160 [Clostridia bacterium]|nr:hypothetical protein FACS18949_16160 [Clostridia bacterium]